jgi:exodeoxyribonuclease VII small subunit
LQELPFQPQVFMTDPIGAFSSNKTDLPLPEAWNYEATVAQVETIIEQIEAGKLELAEVFEQFAAAVKYLRQCETFLQERQQQMDLLIETLAEDADF